MIDLEVTPGLGIGAIRLGMPKEVARETLEKLDLPLLATHGELDYFCDNAIQLEYETGHVRFIGVSNHPLLSCTYKGKDVFDLPSDELFGIVAAGEVEVPEVEEGGTCFFRSQGINLWEADEQYDRKGNYTRKVYGQFGLEQPAT